MVVLERHVFQSVDSFLMGLYGVCELLEVMAVGFRAAWLRDLAWHISTTGRPRRPWRIRDGLHIINRRASITIGRIMLCPTVIRIGGDLESLTQF